VSNLAKLDIGGTEFSGGKGHADYTVYSGEV
jgi:hypothetical protein